MGPRLIAMLTYNDKTVKNAIDIFEECKDLPVECWGFKDVGLPIDQMKEVAKNMKKAEKRTFLEVVTFTEEECLKGVKLAIECEFDYLMGTKYYDSVNDLVRNKTIKYFPFCGEISGSPGVLKGSIPKIIADAKSMEEKGVDGFDLLAYRYVGDPEELARQFIRETKLPVVLAGSVNSFARLDKIKE